MSQSLIELVNSPGVSDLPHPVRNKFALAIKCEQDGEHDRAARLLQEAIQLEQGQR